MERSIWYAMGYVWSEAMHLNESFFYEYRIVRIPLRKPVASNTRSRCILYYFIAPVFIDLVLSFIRQILFLILLLFWFVLIDREICEGKTEESRYTRNRRCHSLAHSDAVSSLALMDGFNKTISSNTYYLYIDIYLSQ